MTLLALAVVLLFLAAWIVIPAPTLALLNLGVAVPETSPLLLVVSLVVAALALNAATTVAHRVAAVLALCAAALCAIPVAQAVPSVRRFEASLDAAGIAAAAGGTTWQTFRRCLPLANGNDVTVTHAVRFAAPEGMVLTLDVYRPAEAGRGLLPIVVQIYGGAWQRGAPEANAVFARYFASRGYVVIAIDYRHAPQWRWPAQIEDVQAALAWIRVHAGEYHGDATRTALLGRSAGGQLALMAAYTGTVLPVRAVVSYYGPTDLLEGWREPPRPDPLPVRPTLEAYLGGAPDTIAERYRAASPVDHVPANPPPTLLVYGRRDHIVAVRFGRELAERLKSRGATGVLLELPWSEHAFDAVPFGLGAQIALRYTERFLASALR